MKLSNVNFRREAWWLLLLATLVPLAGLAALLLWRTGGAG
jgi:hypothetical protein